jgi:hypothetical protein
MAKNVIFLLIIPIILFSSCVMKQDILSSNIKDVNIIVKNNTLNFEDELQNRFTTTNKLSSNILTTTIIKNEVLSSKYKKKIYIKNGIYQYKNCYVDTHYFDVRVEYQNKLNTIKVKTDNDSCDRYEFEDYKAYSVKRAVDEITSFVSK